MTEHETDRLDRLFDTARRADLPPSDALMARIMGDAAQVQAAQAQQPRQRRRSGWVAEVFGGWPALSGVLAAGMAGLWVGVAPPATIESLAADLMGTAQSVTFLPDTTDLTWIEEPSDG